VTARADGRLRHASLGLPVIWPGRLIHWTVEFSQVDNQIARRYCRSVKSSTEASAHLDTHTGRIDKRAAILVAALQTFLQQGYFGDKETLFRTVILDGARRSADSIVASVDALPDTGGDIARLLTGLADSVIKCQLSDEGWALQRLMYAEAPHFPDLFDQALAQGGTRAYNALAGRLARLASRGLLDIPDPDTAASHFFALVSGDLPALSALGTRAVPAAKLRDAVTVGVDTFLRAFGPGTRAGREPAPLEY
jgi:AcrR family transcriptional regulator